MAALERVNQLKKEGLKESEIISRLKEEGYSPMKINDALNQSKIKEAVSTNQNENTTNTKGNPQMIPSIMGNEQEENNDSFDQRVPTPYENQNDNVPSPQGGYTSSPSPEPQDDYSAYTPQDTYTPQTPQDSNYGGYSDYGNYYDEGYSDEPANAYSPSANYSMSSDTMIEIAEQVFSEKMKKIEETIKELKEFKTIFTSKVEDIDSRLKRMEKYFDSMQVSIINKVGDFGKNINTLQKEVAMIEESFSKMVNDITDHKSKTNHKK